MFSQQQLQDQLQQRRRSASTAETGQSDSAWIETQHKTFTNWCNLTLKKFGFSPMKDLVSGFATGENLVRLLNGLSGSDRKYNSDPRMRIQCIENVQTALDMIENDEKIRLVGISPDSIVNGNLKLILGLVWSLIRHFQDVGRIEQQVKRMAQPASSVASTASRSGASDRDKRGTTVPGQDFDLIDQALQNNMRNMSHSSMGFDENPFGDKNDKDSIWWSSSSNTMRGGDSSKFGSASSYHGAGGHDDSLVEGMSNLSMSHGGSSSRGSSSGSGATGGSSSKSALPTLSRDPMEKQNQFRQPFFMQPQYQRDADLSQKQELVKWINHMTQIQVHNFTGDFSDGYILTRLVQRLQWDRKMRPIVKLNPNESSHNRVRKALGWSKEIFGIPNLLDSDDVTDRPDELSMVTYLLCLRTTMLDYDRRAAKGIVDVRKFNPTEYEEKRPSTRDEKRPVRPPTAQTMKDELIARKLQEKYNLEAEREFEKQPGYGVQPQPKQQQPQRSTTTAAPRQPQPQQYQSTHRSSPVTSRHVEQGRSSQRSAAPTRQARTVESDHEMAMRLHREMNEPKSSTVTTTTVRRNTGGIQSDRGLMGRMNEYMHTRHHAAPVQRNVTVHRTTESSRNTPAHRTVTQTTTTSRNTSGFVPPPVPEHLPRPQFEEDDFSADFEEAFSSYNYPHHDDRAYNAPPPRGHSQYPPGPYGYPHEHPQDEQYPQYPPDHSRRYRPNNSRDRNNY